MTRSLTMTVGLVLLAAPVVAQTGQKVSVQVSGLAAALGGNEFEGIGTGVGFEAQIRYNPSAFSIGGGFQFTSHNFDVEGDTEKMKLSGAFVEPRYVLQTNSASVAPYLAARISVLQEKVNLEDGTATASISASGLTLNGGGGLLFRLANSVNLDLGLTFGRTNFGDYTIKVNGVEIDPGDLDLSTDAGGGSSLIMRVGLAIGLGK